MVSDESRDEEPAAATKWCMFCHSELRPIDESEWIDGRARVTCPECGRVIEFQRAQRNQ